MSEKFLPIGSALEGQVKWKKNKAPKIKLKDKLNRVVNNAPEVVVKVTGGAKGAAHIKSHMDYLTRNGKIEAENERGMALKTREELRQEHKEWVADLGKTRKNSRDTINIVLSMPANSDEQTLKEAVRRFAKEQFAENHRYLMVLHTDKNHPHVHLTVKALGEDDRKLDPKKEDLQLWRESFAAKLQELGVEAEATPRFARGVVKKSVSMPVVQADKERRSVVQKSKMEQAVRAVVTGNIERKENPYADKIKERLTNVELKYKQTADLLRQSASPRDQELAQKIEGFLKKRFVGHKTEWDEMITQVKVKQREVLDKQREIQKQQEEKTKTKDLDKDR